MKESNGIMSRCKFLTGRQKVGIVFFFVIVAITIPHAPRISVDEAIIQVKLVFSLLCSGDMYTWIVLLTPMSAFWLLAVFYYTRPKDIIEVGFTMAMILAEVIDVTLLYMCKVKGYGYWNGAAIIDAFLCMIVLTCFIFAYKYAIFDEEDLNPTYKTMKKLRCGQIISFSDNEQWCIICDIIRLKHRLYILVAKVNSTEDDFVEGEYSFFEILKKGTLIKVVDLHILVKLISMIEAKCEFYMGEDLFKDLKKWFDVIRGLQHKDMTIRSETNSKYEK